jgi:predicted metal-dependent hydrolase
MEKDKLLKKGVGEFNEGRFFECHETLEQIWLKEEGSEKDFYQGIIQVAAGYYKMEGGGLVGAIKLLSSGLNRLLPFRPAHQGIDLERFLRGVELGLKEIEIVHAQGGDSVSLSAPVLSFSLEPIQHNGPGESTA